LVFPNDVHDGSLTLLKETSAQGQNHPLNYYIPYSEVVSYMVNLTSIELEKMGLYVEGAIYPWNQLHKLGKMKE
jgi:hypothetical protein